MFNQMTNSDIHYARIPVGTSYLEFYSYCPVSLFFLLILYKFMFCFVLISYFSFQQHIISKCKTTF